MPIDDDALQLEVIKEMLERNGVSCMICDTTRVLLEEIRNKDYDLVLTDIQMPGTNGFGVLELLRKSRIGNSRTIPVVAMTAREDGDKGCCFDTAKGGTLFLDEIGTLPFDMQSSMLRVLQEGIFMPVGSTMERIADVRIVATTNENMEKAIAEGHFREDLYHRLNEFEICQPALRECPEDILPLANFFREKYSLELHRKRTGFTQEAERLLLSYPWSGNIWEWQNKVRRAVTWP